MKNKKFYIKNLINYFFKNKKVNIFDAGAHKGLFLKKIGLTKIKNAILVDPIDFKIIHKKNFKRFKYIKALLGEKISKKNFYIHSNTNPEWSSINKIHKQSPYYKLYKRRLNKKLITKNIKQQTIDNILKKINFQIDIIKIDCQSQTLEVLRGSSKTLGNKNLKIVICAINLTDFYHKKSDDFVSICNFLKRFKLNLYSFVNAHDGSLGKIDFDFKNFKVWTFDAVFLKNEK